MAKIVSLILLVHFIGIGMLLEIYPNFFRTRVLALVFAYFFVAHVAAGYLLSAHPELVDPRTSESLP